MWIYNIYGAGKPLWIDLPTQTVVLRLNGHAVVTVVVVRGEEKPSKSSMSKRHLVSAIAFVFFKRWPTDNPIPSSSSSSSSSLSPVHNHRGRKETSDLSGGALLPHPKRYVVLAVYFVCFSHISVVDLCACWCANEVEWRRRKKKMGFVVVISVPLILLVAILALACYLLGRRKGRTESTPMYYGPPAPPMAAGPPPKWVSRCKETMWSRLITRFEWLLVGRACVA